MFYVFWFISLTRKHFCFLHFFIFLSLLFTSTISQNNRTVNAAQLEVPDSKFPYEVQSYSCIAFSQTICVAINKFNLCRVYCISFFSLLSTRVHLLLKLHILSLSLSLATRYTMYVHAFLSLS